MDGGQHSFWRSKHGVDDIVFTIPLLTKHMINMIEIQWRGFFSARAYTIELSEQGETWVEVHRVTETTYPDPVNQRLDKIALKGLPSAGILYVRLSLTKRWYGDYRLQSFRVLANEIPGGQMYKEDTLTWKGSVLPPPLY